MNLPQNKETKTSNEKQDFLSKFQKNSFKVGKDTGTLHFHNETLRHSTGEFTLNRLFSISPPKPSNFSLKSSKKVRNSSKSKSLKPGYKKLLENTQKILQNKKSSPLRPCSKPRPFSALKGKSRKYLNLSSIF
jgi:hypothetical protein